VKLKQQSDGWHIEIPLDRSWAEKQQRQVVTTDLLGKAAIPDLPYENPDGSMLRLNTDYFGKQRSRSNPFPGPFEASQTGNLQAKVWPVAAGQGL